MTAAVCLLDQTDTVPISLLICVSLSHCFPSSSPPSLLSSSSSSLLVHSAILSGKELFNYNSALFVDDEGAIDASEENALAMQTKIGEWMLSEWLLSLSVRLSVDNRTLPLDVFLQSI